MSPVRGESSRSFKDVATVESSSEIDKDSARSELMFRDGIPPGGSSAGDEASPEDFTRFFSDASALFYFFGDGRTRPRLRTPRANRDRGTVALIPIASIIKFSLLIKLLAVKLLLLKSLALAKASLALSVLLIFIALYNRTKDALIHPAKQYPEYEPDLSGFGYTRPSNEWTTSDSPHSWAQSEREVAVEFPVASANQRQIRWTKRRSHLVKSGSFRTRETSNHSNYNFPA